MHTTAEWIVIGCAFVWWIAPWLLVVRPWRKWAQARTPGNPLEDLIDDPALVVGQILATVSCCALLAFLLPATKGMRVRAADNLLIAGGLLAIIGCLVLPFGLQPAKWTVFLSCLLNAGFVVAIIAVESA